MKPSDTWFGRWHYSSANRIAAIGDFDGDSTADLLVTSDWGISILSLWGDNLTPRMSAPNGTWFGGWLFHSQNNTFGPTGDVTGDNRDDIVIQSGWGTGILELSGSSLVLFDASPNEDLFGSWLLENDDRVIAAADFDPLSDGDELLFQKSP